MTKLTFVCPQCGFHDPPIWKPLAWRLYVSYAPYPDFIREYPSLDMRKGERREDDHYVYRRLTEKATRDIVHRYPKAFSMMMQRELYEKTPSEKVKKES